MVSNKVLKLVYNLEKNWEENRTNPNLLIEEFLNSFDAITGRIPGTSHTVEKVLREENPYPFWS